MIIKGVNVLVIVVIDGMMLLNVLVNVKVVDVKIIVYDWLICDMFDIDYYVIFDNFKVGVE